MCNLKNCSSLPLDTVVFLKNREVIYEKPNSVTKTILSVKGSV